MTHQQPHPSGALTPLHDNQASGHYDQQAILHGRRIGAQWGVKGGENGKVCRS